MTDRHRMALDSTLRDIALQKGYDSPQMDVLAFHSAGAGYTSQLFRGKISAPNKEDIKFFAKVAALDSEARTTLPAPIFLTEQYAYRRLADIYTKIEDKHDLDQEYRFVFPIIYGYRDTDLEEVIVMQDLIADGFMLQDRFSSFDWAYASAAVQQIARFHSLSIALQRDFPDDYKEVTETFKFKQCDGMVEQVRQTALKFIELIKEEHRDRLQTFLKENLHKAIATYYDTPPRPVINHGDFRMSNIMHRERKDGNIEAVLIDYQILHVASPMKDLMYFIFTGSDAAFRRRHYRQLLNHYHQELSLALARLHFDPKQIFSKEDFEADLKENICVGLLFALTTIPVVMVEECDAPAPGAASGALAVEAIKRAGASQLCRDRLNEVVADYVHIVVDNFESSVPLLNWSGYYAGTRHDFCLIHVHFETHSREAVERDDSYNRSGIRGGASAWLRRVGCVVGLSDSEGIVKY